MALAANGFLPLTQKEADGEYYVYLNGGRTATQTTCLDWAKQAVDMGAGEILLTSMDHDGTKKGFALELTCLLAGTLPVPVIASGGGGNLVHFSQIFKEGKADAALAASIFHFREISIITLKEYLKEEGISIRI
jgi:cyclase